MLIGYVLFQVQQNPVGSCWIFVAYSSFFSPFLCFFQPDRTIKVYNVSESSYELSATLANLHEGPVWQVSWAHPQFGVVLASCSFDGSVLIHKESRPREWSVLHAARQLHDSSINSVAFCPPEFGMQLAAASSDGRVSVLQYDTSTHAWRVHYLQDCPSGVNAVSWAPAGAYYEKPSTEDCAEKQEAPRLVTAGCDNQIRFWVYQAPNQEGSGSGTETLGQWVPDPLATIRSPVHSDWVRDVAWAPVLLPNRNVVASCSEDQTVWIWTQDRTINTTDESGDSSPSAIEWKPTLLHSFDAPVWRVSWSITGHLLAVSAGDADVTLWKAGVDGTWSQVSSVPEGETGSPATQPQG